MKTLPKIPEIPPSALEAIKKGVEEKHSICDLEQLGVNQKFINLLESNGISNLQDLMFKTKESLLEIPNFGVKNLVYLFKALSKYDEIVQ